MADTDKPAAASSNVRDNQVLEPSQHQQQPAPEASSSAQRSIEMNDLSVTAKATAIASTPVDVPDGNDALSGHRSTTDTEQPEQSTSTAAHRAAVSAVSANSEDAVAHPLKSEDKAVVTSAPTVPEQESLTIDPAEPTGEEPSSSDPVVDIMLIVTQSNSRHLFRISEKYLTKRNVAVPGLTEDGRIEPMSITVYTLKELILRDWRKEWETPPREPVSIRLIYFGKMLEDKLPLSHYNLSHNTKNVVHMTVKPQEIIDEEEANKKVKESGASARGSGCCIIL